MREGPARRHDAGRARRLLAWPRRWRCCWRAAACAGDAGAQVEEPLADAVRSALAAAVANAAPPQPALRHDRRPAGLPALAGRDERAAEAPQDRAPRASSSSRRVWYESRRAGLEPALVLGLIQVESGFRKYAISAAGARGYMQVMPFWARLIGDGDASRLFHMQTNLRFGCVILRHYLDIERGDLFLALGRYNGSRGRAEYPNAVFAAAPVAGTSRWPDARRAPAASSRSKPCARPSQRCGAAPCTPSSASTRSTRVVDHLVDALRAGGRTPAAAGRRCRPSR